MERDASHEVIRGCDGSNGYNADGTVLLERLKDVQKIKKEMNEVVTSCSCKGDCTMRRCSCFKKNEKCIGCGCTEDMCKNRPASG